MAYKVGFECTDEELKRIRESLDHRRVTPNLASDWLERLLGTIATLKAKVAVVEDAEKRKPDGSLRDQSLIQHG